MGASSIRAISVRSRVLFSTLVAAVIGAVVATAVAAFSPSPFLNGWLAAAVLAIPAIYALISAWRWAGGGRALAWMVALAFVLRLVVGIGLSLALPVWGYDEPAQNDGYLFKDAHLRDAQAWELSQSDRPLWGSFREDFYADQYGGLMGLSAFVYRYFSPDAHRPFLILILGAFITALGVPFLVQAVRMRWTERMAMIAGWIFAFYPDALYFGGSQMREPILVGLTAVAFWAVLAWDWRRRGPWVALISSLLVMAVISNRVAVAVAGMLGLLFLLEQIPVMKDRRWRLAGWVLLGISVLAVLTFTWEWFISSTQWDTLLTARASGQIETRLKEIGQQWMIPFIAVYGVLQPVLPAAITETSIPLAKTIIIIRSLGWYALAPFLLYGLVLPFAVRDSRQRKLAIWLVAVVFLWLLIAALRGGGDHVDNPRYRSLFLPWLALLAAWSVEWALARKNAWLWRLVAVEGIFLAFFTHWYMGRYYRMWLKMDFWSMVFWIIGLSALVLVGGWLWDRYSGKWRKQPRMML